jgi:poly-beta-1,6-N-acetyl-D-glucosamine synthase
MTDTLKIVFWISLGAVFYAYVGYPLALPFLRLIVNRPVRKQFVAEPVLPTVTVIVPAMNEAAVIGEKIQNVGLLKYPRDKLELLIVSDGSTDDTVRIAQSFADGRRIRVLAFNENRGKASVLNDAVRDASGELIVFSDASALLDSNSVGELVANFADPSVGAVSGIYRVMDADASHTGPQEDFYWRYETFLKIQESSLASVLGGHGHILAVRKALYSDLPATTINDDFIIPVNVMAQGMRVVYEPKAIAYERAREMEGFGRRVRILAGNLQQFGAIKGFLWPPQLLPIFFFLSHKLARTVAPFFLLALAISNATLLGESFYRSPAAVQALFYGLALAGRYRGLRPKVLRLPYYFCCVNAAYLWGFFHSRAGTRKVRWK